MCCQTQRDPRNSNGSAVTENKLQVAALLVINFGVLKIIKTDRQKLVYLLTATLIVFGLYSIGIKSLFLLAFMGFNLISAINGNFIRPMLHEHIDSKWRATAISSYSFAGNLLQAVAAVAVGAAIQMNGVVFAQRSLLIVFLVIGVPSFLIYLPNANNNLQNIKRL